MLAVAFSILAWIVVPEFPERAVDTVRVTYVGNEGFLLESDGKKVLIDALYRSGVSGYVVHQPDVRKRLERALPPFDNVDVVLATHFHADHFDPDAVGVHLISNRNALFVTTNQAAGQMSGYQAYRNIQARVMGVLPPEGGEEVVEHNGVRIRALNLHHGRTRPVENLGFLVEIGERRFLHVGDTEITASELESLQLDKESIDFFMVPYWLLFTAESDVNVVSTVKANTVLPMHLPPPDDPRNFMADDGGFEGTLERIRSNFPDVVTFEDVMTTHSFP